MNTPGGTEKCHHIYTPPQGCLPGLNYSTRYHIFCVIIYTLCVRWRSARQRAGPLQRQGGDDVCRVPVLEAYKRCIYPLVPVHIYIYFCHRTLSALPHNELPTLEPGTRPRISARFMAPGHETPRAHWGGAPRAGGHSARPSGDVCAVPLLLEGSPEIRGVPSSGAGPSQNGTCSGGGVGRKSGLGEVLNCFRFERTRVCIREPV